MVLWSSVWGEDKESGLCTGLPQDEWMRLAIKLRDTYDPDVALAGSDILASGVTTGAAVAELFNSQFGRMPLVKCSQG